MNDLMNIREKIGLNNSEDAIIMRLYSYAICEQFQTLDSELKTLVKSKYWPKCLDELLFVDDSKIIKEYLADLMEKRNLDRHSSTRLVELEEQYALGKWLNNGINDVELITFCYEEVWKKSDFESIHTIWMWLYEDYCDLEENEDAGKFYLTKGNFHQDLLEALIHNGKING